MLLTVKLEDRICACGCGKSFRCLPSSKTRYSSLHCMEVAGALPPVEKFGRGGKGVRTAGAPTGAGAPPEDDSEPDLDADNDEVPLLLEEDEGMDSDIPGNPDGKNPPEIDPAI